MAIIWIVLEGLFYTGGTYFFAKDSKPYYHGIWHLFVLAGAVSHQMAIISILRNSLLIS
jgi:hemolysin III